MSPLTAQKLFELMRKLLIQDHLLPQRLGQLTDLAMRCVDVIRDCGGLVRHILMYGDARICVGMISQIISGGRSHVTRHFFWSESSQCRRLLRPALRCSIRDSWSRARASETCPFHAFSRTPRYQSQSESQNAHCSAPRADPQLRAGWRARGRSVHRPHPARRGSSPPIPGSSGRGCLSVMSRRIAIDPTIIPQAGGLELCLPNFSNVGIG